LSGENVAIWDWLLEAALEQFAKIAARLAPAGAWAGKGLNE
jgi:hypothetical protein